MNQTLDLNQKDDDGCTPLHLAVMNRHDELVRSLVKAGVNILSEDKHGRTAIYLAKENSNKDLVMELLKNLDMNNPEILTKVLMQLIH